MEVTGSTIDLAVARNWIRRRERKRIGIADDINIVFGIERDPAAHVGPIRAAEISGEDELITRRV